MGQRRYSVELKALTRLERAGRFDRQIVVDKPDLVDRTAILQSHARGMKLGTDVDLRLAQRTPRFVGADLANIHQRSRHRGRAARAPCGDHVGL